MNPDRHRQFKRYSGLALLLVSLLGACCLAGYLHGRSGLTQLKAQLDAERLAARTGQERMMKQLEAERQLTLMLEARRCLDQAITALDDRNFGIAEQQIRKSAQWLAAARPDASVAELAKTLGSFHLVATEDLGPQRRQLVEWVARLDPLIVVPNP